MKVRAALLVVVVLVLAMSAPAKRIEILRHTVRTWQDEPIVLMIRIAPHQDNRRLIVTAHDQDGFVVTSSLEQLPGARAPRTRWVRWATLPAGEMTVRAQLYEQDGEHPRAVARARVIVLPR